MSAVAGRGAIDAGCLQHRLSIIAEGAQRSNKAFIFPRKMRIFAFGPKEVFIKSFDVAKKDQLFPGQGAIELFQRVSKTEETGEDTIAELEFYGKHVVLAKG
jgi:hypothetical protein